MVGASMAAFDRRGFTLIEAMIATVLGALVIGLVVSVMVAQGGYFGDVHQRAALQGNVRSSADLLREELQAVPRGAVLTAQNDELLVLVPIAMGVVCGEVEGPVGKGKGKGGKGPVASAPAYLPFPGGGAGADRVSWYGIRGSDGNWLYREGNPLNGGGGNPANECVQVGADNTLGKGEFRNLTGLQSPALPEYGDLVALFTEVEFRLAASLLNPGSVALFRREGTGAAVEFADALTGDSRFRYRRAGETDFQDSVTGGQLAEIVEIRVLAFAESLDSRGGAGPLAYDWDFRIPLRNAP